MFNDIQIEDIIESMGFLVSQPQLITVFAYMFAASMLVGGVLNWSSKSYKIYFLTTAIGYAFFEWIRFTYLVEIKGDTYSAFPMAMALLVFIVYTGGILFGIFIVRLTRIRCYKPSESYITDLMDESMKHAQNMKRKGD